MFSMILYFDSIIYKNQNEIRKSEADGSAPGREFIRVMRSFVEEKGLPTVKKFESSKLLIHFPQLLQ